MIVGYDRLNTLTPFLGQFPKFWFFPSSLCQYTNHSSVCFVSEEHSLAALMF